MEQAILQLLVPEVAKISFTHYILGQYRYSLFFQLNFKPTLK